MIIKKLNNRQAKWAKTLAEYDFVIWYCKEKNNVWADTLSRWVDFINHEETIVVSLLEKNNAEDLHYCEARAINIIAEAIKMLE